VNAYSIQFASRCPTNGVRINYTLRIETREVIPVEQIVAAVEAVESGEGAYHEEIADHLAAQFPGAHLLSAMHHGVLIETTRGKEQSQ
jgi:hypothetical protein